jgi:hypothetical protein
MIFGTMKSRNFFPKRILQSERFLMFCLMQSIENQQLTQQIYSQFPCTLKSILAKVLNPRFNDNAYTNALPCL